MRGLIRYFKDYIEKLKKISSLDADVYVDADVFVTYGLGFKIQALAGFAESDTDGEFTLIFMVNIGQEPVDNFRIYVGGESEVSLAELQEFLESLQKVIDQHQKDERKPNDDT